MDPLIIEVPSPLGLRPSGLEDAPGALRAAGLHERLGFPLWCALTCRPIAMCATPARES